MFVELYMTVYVHEREKVGQEFRGHLSTQILLNLGDCIKLNHQVL